MARRSVTATALGARASSEARVDSSRGGAAWTYPDPDAQAGGGGGGGSSYIAGTGVSDGVVHTDGLNSGQVNGGNGQVMFSYTVPPALGFTGFAQPIDNAGVNSAKAGQTVPVKYRLTTAAGTPVSDPASFVRVTSHSGGRGPAAGSDRDLLHHLRVCSTSVTATGSSTGGRRRAMRASAAR
jgi:hypothetical protein